MQLDALVADHNRQFENAVRSLHPDSLFDPCSQFVPSERGLPMEIEWIENPRGIVASGGGTVEPHIGVVDGQGRVRFHRAVSSVKGGRSRGGAKFLQ
jgi:hypothetical protein